MIQNPPGRIARARSEMQSEGFHAWCCLRQQACPFRVPPAACRSMSMKTIKTIPKFDKMLKAHGVYCYQFSARRTDGALASVCGQMQGVFGVLRILHRPVCCRTAPESVPAACTLCPNTWKAGFRAETCAWKCAWHSDDGACRLYGQDAVLSGSIVLRGIWSIWQVQRESAAGYSKSFRGYTCPAWRYDRFWRCPRGTDRAVRAAGSDGLFYFNMACQVYYRAQERIQGAFRACGNSKTGVPRKEGVFRKNTGGKRGTDTDSSCAD